MNPSPPVPGPDPTPAPARPAPTPARRPRRPRRWLPYALATALVLVLVAGFRPQPIPVETSHVTRGLLREVIAEEGRTRIRHRFTVSAPVHGQLRRIDLKPGAPVEAGTTIVATLDPITPTLLDARARSLAEARRDAAAAQLDKARTAHRFATNDLRRFEQLFAEKTVSQQELESFQWRDAAAAKELAAAESALRQAEAELAQFTPSTTPSANPAPVAIDLRAPASGRVLRVFEENARVVSAGTPLLELGDPTDLEVVIEVLSRDGATIPAGAPVELHQWGAPEQLHARVRLVEPAGFTKISALGVEEQRVNVIADLVSPPETRPGLGDQFRVEARIIVWQTDDALQVPVGALFRRGTAWAAFTLANGRAALRTVTVGRTSGTATQILDGLRDGDPVILYAGDRVREGQRVRPVQVSPAP